MNTGGLSLDQAPPRAVPFTFYVFIPLALVAAGALLAWDGAALFATGWSPRTMALAHLGTLGVLGAAMLGSLYQMVPVIAGARVPAIRLGYGVAGLFGLGLGAFAYGLAVYTPAAVRAGGVCLGLAVVCFVGPVGLALWRTRARSETAWGMRAAVLALAVLAGLGLRLAWGHAGGTMPVARQPLLAAHLVVALVGWVGTLLAAVSWQVLPMFHLTPGFPKGYMRTAVVVLSLSPLAAAGVAVGGGDVPSVAVAGAPGVLVAWVAQPWFVATQVRRRKRRRADPALSFWWVSMASAGLALGAAMLLLTTSWAPAGLLFGWLAIWGWAGAPVLGMLTRIVPFLVWFHGIAAYPGQRFPPMKQLLGDREVAALGRAHLLTGALGVSAIVTGGELTTRLAGGGLVATGGLLAFVLFRAVRRGRPVSGTQRA